MKTVKILAFSLFATLAMVSCSDDDDNNTPDPTDDDGTQVDLRAELYASNTNNGNITVYDVADNQIESRTLLTPSTSSEGIFYDKDRDQVVQASRSLLQLNAYRNISLTEGGLNAELLFSSSADLQSPRDIAVNGNIYVVSDNGDFDNDPSTVQGRFFVYTRSENGFALRNTVTVNFDVWGIEFDGTTLYAVVDKTNDVAIFDNFLTTSTDTELEPTKRVSFDGLIRTHGIAIDGEFMVLTDIGDAASDRDGAFHVIPNYEATIANVANEGTIGTNAQVRFSGNGTSLGNPVSVDYDVENNTIYIAEAANAGGQILIFRNPIFSGGNGNVTPSANFNLAGASSVYFYKETE